MSSPLRLSVSRFQLHSVPATIGLASAALMATYYPVNRWGLMGMEIAPLCVVLTGALCLLLAAQRAGRASAAAYLLGLGTILRLDFAALTLLLWLAMIIADRSARACHLVFGAVILGACLIGQTAFRRVCCGDWLPNTYYLKMTGFPVLYRITRGLQVLKAFIA